MREEYLACREGVGIIDMSSFSKIEIKVILLRMSCISVNSDLTSVRWTCSRELSTKIVFERC